MRTPGAKREERKKDVRDYLLIHGPSLLGDISRGTRLTSAAVSKALVAIRNDPAYEYATVATKDGGYLYRIAVTVEETKAGLINQAKHDRTRGESMVAAGAKLTTLAATPDDFRIAAEVSANGRLLQMQAQAILAALR